MVRKTSEVVVREGQFRVHIVLRMFKTKCETRSSVDNPIGLDEGFVIDPGQEVVVEGRVGVDKGDRPICLGGTEVRNILLIPHHQKLPFLTTSVLKDIPQLLRIKTNFRKFVVIEVQTIVGANRTIHFVHPLT
jgi:hypothetical protein